jgi:hypothetical protein
MHVNYTYFENMYEIKDVDEKNFYISVSYNDNDILKHKAYLYSFLNAYQLLIICLGEALFLKYQQYPELKNLYKPNVRHTWEKTIAELIATRPDLKEILDSYGLWTIEHPFV